MNTIIYKRVSTDDQADRGFSLQHQENVLRQFCAFNKFNVIEVYTEDYSGKDFERPEWKKIITYIKKNKNKVDQILCLRWDRFSRNQYLALQEIRSLEKLGVKIITAEQPIDLTNPDNKVLLSLYLTLPEVENDKNSIRTTEGSRRARFEGCWTGSAPRGYDNCRIDTKSSLTPNDKAPLIKECFERLATGLYSANEVRLYINRNGLNIPKQSFYHLIRNIAYIGKIYVKAWKKEPEEIVNGLHPPLVTEDLFNRANKVLDGRSRQKNFNTDKTDLYPMKGFMKCHIHGRTLSAYKCKSRSGKYHHYYICTKPKCQRHRIDDVHNTIKRFLEKISVTAGMVKVYKSSLEQMIDRDDNQRISNINKTIIEIEKVNLRKVTLEDSFLDGLILPDDFRSIKKRIDEELIDLTDALRDLKCHKSPFKEYLNKTLPMIENLSKYWDLADGNTKKKILGCIFSEKFENLNLEVATTPFTPEIISILNAGKVLKRSKNKQEVKNDLLSHMAPPLGLEPRTL